MSRRVAQVHRWVGIPTLAFALGMTVLWGWKQQLTRQLRAASADQRLEPCLQLERRLQLLEWVPSPPSADSGRCRREAAEALWGAGKRDLALRLQQEIVRSKAATSDDLERLQGWKAEVQRAALKAFDAGELERALALLRESDSSGGDPGVAAMTAQLRQIWEKNRADLARAKAMAARRKWWEALAALNDLQHPYWRQQGLSLRARVEKNLSKVEKARVDTHGPLPFAISREKLDALVRRRLAAGVPEWQAFGEACRALGGRVVDGGPEASCDQ